MRARLPELPDAKRQRLVLQCGIKPEDARLLAEDRPVAEFFEATVSAVAGVVEPQLVANWLLGDLFRLLRDRGVGIDRAPVTPARFSGLLALVGRGAINATVAKEVLEEMFTSGEEAQFIVQRRGLSQISDEAQVAGVVRQVLEQNPKPVQQYLEGKEQVLGFLVGQVMRATRGQANVQVANRLIVQELNKRKTA